MDKIIIGSRGSDLALWQANHIKKQLESLSCEVEIKVIVTQGDAIQHLSFDKLEGKGFFTKEIEIALLAKEIDLAVHSHKDLETNPPEGLKIAAVSEREDPSELLLIRKTETDFSKKWNLKEAGIIGTSSARRKSQVIRYRPDLIIKELRGNVPTRIEKLRDAQYDAILLAKAGVDRLQLNLSDFHIEVLDTLEFIPAPAQGVLGLQIRSNDKKTEEIVSKLNHSSIAENINLERLILNKMEGGCQLPLGVYYPENSNKIYVSYSQNSETASQSFSFTIGNNIVNEVINKLSKLSD